MSIAGELKHQILNRNVFISTKRESVIAWKHAKINKDSFGKSYLLTFSFYYSFAEYELSVFFYCNENTDSANGVW